MFSFDTPHTPPTTKEDDLAVLRLIRSRRVGPATFHRLIAEHGSAAAALDALPQIAAAASIDGYQPCPEGVAAAEIAAGRRAGARLILWTSPEYPDLLRTIGDAPPVLWLRGDAGLLRRVLVAVIGSRNASSLGLRLARGLARGLAEAGIAVAGGLARGIDTAAHDASCERGTVAVMAGGIDVVYPAENQALAERICETGCLITEQPPGTEPVARHFPARNRIVAGLCAGTVVVEAAHRSGSLITARCAADQGREVMAVPGHPMDARAAGCNALIRDGATLVRNAEDVIEALGLTDARLPFAGSSDRGNAADEAGGPAPHAVAEKRFAGSAFRAARTAAPPAASTIAAAGRESEARATAVRAERPAPPPPSRAATAESAGQHSPSAADDGAGSLMTRLLDRLSPAPVEENLIIRDLGVTPARIAPLMLELELDGRLTRLPGGRVALVP